MFFPKRTKLAMSVYLEGTKIRKILSCIYLNITQYKLVSNEGSVRAEYLFIISHEKIVREDHLKVFTKIFNHVIDKQKGDCLKLEYKRVFGFSLGRLYKSKFNLHNLLKEQMNEIVKDINFQGLKKVIVFCDTSPLQNYIVEYCYNHDVETLGMQHGFYPIPNNDYWRRVYLASNAHTFAAWDNQTLGFMNQYSRGRKRDFLQVGPININEKKINKNNAELSVLKKIAIYGAGIDQIEINNYLVDLSKYIKNNSDLEVTFICHPYFKLIDRIKHTIKTGVSHESNKRKHDNYDCHIVLNSSVWLELEQKNLRYIRLDTVYLNQIPLVEVLKKIYNSNSLSDIDNNDNSLKMPFCSDEEALMKISNFILESSN